MMPRGVDHIVHAVRDLDAAAEAYARLGFIVGALNRHSWGTHNRIIQFDDAYIELLTIGEPDKIEPHSSRSFSFGGFHRDFLANGQGLDMILLQTSDAAADAVAFREASIGDFEVFNFERQGSRPDGTSVKLAFSLVFAVDPNAPWAGFGTCQHYFPENFWNTEFQKHANGIRRIAGVVLVANEPDQHRKFLQSYIPAQNTRNYDGGFAIDLPNTTVDVLTPAAFKRRFGMPAPNPASGARFAALRFAVPDANGGSVKTIMGANLVFEEAMGGPR